MSKHGRVNVRSPIEELDNLQVVNRHTYDGPRDRSYLYIGRGTPLGNNWSHVAGTTAQFKVETRLDAIAEYRRWLWTQIQSAKGPAFEALQEIKDRVTNGEKINLACHPQPCHGTDSREQTSFIFSHAWNHIRFSSHSHHPGDL